MHNIILTILHNIAYCKDTKKHPNTPLIIVEKRKKDKVTSKNSLGVKKCRWHFDSAAEMKKCRWHFDSAAENVRSQ